MHDLQYDLFKSEEKELCLGLTHAEFRCRCDYKECRHTPVFIPLLEIYERFRKALNVPLNIGCGYRCPRHNFDVGGVPRSKHMSSRAIDVLNTGDITQWSSDEVLKVAKEAGFVFCYFDPHKNFYHLQIVN